MLWTVLLVIICILHTRYVKEIKNGEVVIGKEEFVALISQHREQEKRVDSLCKIFSNSFESPVIEWGFIMFDNLMKAYFDSKGVDWINYYLYENPEKCYYHNNEKISLETPDDLWLLIESYRK